MIYAETPRLILRSLKKSDLPRVAELIGDWDVSRWLAVVPHPYTLAHAEEFYDRMTEALQNGKPEYYLIQTKDGQQVGAIGLHPPREPSPPQGKMIVGYWLGKPYWGQGIMSEALQPIIDLAFARPEVNVLAADTDPENQASQNVLRKAGFNYLGIAPSKDPKNIRGIQDVTCWQLTRSDYETRKKAA